MKRYIGTKQVNAKPMNRLAYNQLRKWQLPADENGADEGYLVEYVDGGAANHPDFQGYISWSPKEVFERAYSEADGLTFGAAIEAMRQGLKVSRAGWNGKGMFIFLDHGNRCAYGFEGVPRRDFIVMKTAQGDQVPWVASQSDMLATDWALV